MSPISSSHVAPRLPHAGRRLAAGLALCALMLAACSKPAPEQPENPPAPQAAAATPEDAKATQLRDTIQAPLEQAREVKQASEDAATQQRAEIDAATQ